MCVSRKHQQLPGRKHMLTFECSSCMPEPQSQQQVRAFCSLPIKACKMALMCSSLWYSFGVQLPEDPTVDNGKHDLMIILILGHCTTCMKTHVKREPAAGKSVTESIYVIDLAFLPHSPFPCHFWGLMWLSNIAGVVYHYSQMLRMTCTSK